MAFAFLALTSLLHAQDIISSVEIEGPRRTKESTVLTIIKVKEGDPVTDDLLEDVEQRLRRSGIFQDEMDIRLTPDGAGQNLSIYVQDKWTLIGLPFFSVSNGAVGGGAFFMESNLFGRQKLLLASVAAGQDSGISAFTMFSDPSVAQSPYSLFTALGGGNSLTTLTDLSGETEWESYSSAGANGSVGVGYEFSDALSLGTRLSAEYWKNSAEDITPPDGGENNMDTSLSLEIALDKRYVRSLFSSGYSGSLGGGFSWEYPLEGSWDASLFAKADSSYGFVFGDDVLLLQGRLEGGVTNDDFHSLFVLGGSSGSHTLPSRKIAASAYGTGEILTEVRLVNFGFGSITIPVIYEGGLLTDYQGDLQGYHGVGGGLRFYLSKVAVPALGLDYVYNFTTGYSGLSFFLGMSG